MFVVWKWGDHHRFPCSVQSACVVRSVRTPDGPRQQYVTYLGSITHPDDTMWGDSKQGKFLTAEIIEPSVGGERYQHRQFWATALSNLERAGIVGDDREKIIAELERTIPRPDGFDPSPRDLEDVRLRRRAAQARNDAADARRFRRQIDARRSRAGGDSD
jgi:hypothetical protein